MHRHEHVTRSNPVTPFPGEGITPAYAHYVLVLLFVVYVFNFIDRQILAILLEAIKQDGYVRPPSLVTLASRRRSPPAGNLPRGSDLAQSIRLRGKLQRRAQTCSARPGTGA